MERKFYNNLVDTSLSGEDIGFDVAKEILCSQDIQILPLLNAAYEIRRYYRGMDITIHIINNAANGSCQEDCSYCAQAKTSKSEIEEYPIKSNEEFMAEAENAYKKGAHRYCMVFSGRGPSQSRVKALSSLIKQIKEKYPIEICVSTGLLDQNKARQLKEAGLDRLNHNLNTSEKHYAEICTTHTYQDRLNTLQAAKNVGLEICSGVIVGMQELTEDILECAYKLREIEAKSIPVNFFIPIKGNKLSELPNITPEFCLRVLCLYRFLNPIAEIRAAAGRELHLRDLEVMAFYAADSLFLNGYLNTKGNACLKTLQMLKDAGFTIKSEYDIAELIKNESDNLLPDTVDNVSSIMMKNIKELRPQMP